MILQDVRYALRSLRRSAGFTTVAILCLGFGIGVNSTIFSIVDGVLLKPFPYHEPDRIVVPEAENQPLEVSGASISYLDLLDWKARTSAFAGLGAVQTRSLTISDGGGDPERYIGGLVTWDLFPMLGVSPTIGKGFSEQDDRPGGGGVVILSHNLWTRRYQADPNVIGRRVLINAAPTIIIGVMPAGFEFPNNQKLWLPVAPLAFKDARDVRSLQPFARLRAGISIDQARTELSAVAAAIAREHPDTNENWGAQVSTLRETFIPGEVTRVIWLMMAGVTLVLFIACSNVANLQLARASARRREISVRAALGAERRRIITQLLTESVVLSLVAVPFGILLAEFGTRLIASAIPTDQVPNYITWTVDYRSVLFTIAIAVGTAMLFGLFPALQVSRGELHADLKEGTRGNSVRRSALRSSLVVLQISLSIVALVGALLFVKSFTNIDSYDVGFDTRPLMTMRFYMPGDAYTPADAKARRAQDIVERIERLPGVEAAFASNLVPISGGGGFENVVVDGLPAERGREPLISFTGVTPHFYRTLGRSLRRGHDFADAEGWSRSNVAIINETMAERFWKGRDAVGGRFRMVRSEVGDAWFTVIGVAADIKQDDIDPDDRPFPAAYVPYIYQQTLNTGLTIRVASGSPAAVTSAVRNEIRVADTNLPVFQVATMEDVRRLSFWQYGLYSWIFGTIGVIGLLLAAIGVYGVLSYSVAQRTPEIGMRMALGANRRDVLKLVVSHGMALASIGVVIGLGLSALAMPQARALLY
jgi:putative ABC transport system permease protein